MSPSRSPLALVLATLLLSASPDAEGDSGSFQVTTGSKGPSTAQKPAAAQKPTGSRKSTTAQKPVVTAEKKSSPKAGLVVVAPHPDDEALIASGVILRAIAEQEPVAVIIVTSGDFDCRVDAKRREAESVAGLAALGVSEEQIFFLGYPDGSLARLGRSPLPPVRRLIAGQCVFGNTTYGQRGHHRQDVHRARTGKPGDYTAQGLVSDLQSLLDTLKPATLVVTHPEDTHPDHAATYAFVRRALNHLDQAPRLLRAMVHSEDCWPTGGSDVQHCLPGHIAPSEPTPAFTGSLHGYEPDLRLPVPAPCLLPSLGENPKLRAIASHISQTGGDLASYLLTFARSDELFFSEDLIKSSDGKWTPLPAPPHPAAPGLTVHPGEKLSLLQQSPFTWSVKLRRPRDDTHTQINLMRGGRGSYELSFDSSHLHATLNRRTPENQLIFLQQWLLPHDTWQDSTQVERFDLSLTPRGTKGDAELTLFYNEQLLGVAVDLDPLTQGEAVELDSTSIGDITLSYSPVQPQGRRR